MTGRTADVVVIGGGPGGSTAATLLARKGWQVLLVEKQTFPRFRIGESMLPMTRAIYERLGVADEIDRRFIRKYGAHFIKGDRELEHIFEFRNAMDCPYPYAYEVPRAEHDRLLLENARRAGAEVLEGWQVDDVLFEGERARGVRISPAAPSAPSEGLPGIGGGGPEETAAAGVRPAGEEAVTISAPFVVDASGRWSVIAKRLRLREPHPDLNKAAVFTHYRGVKRLPGIHEGTISIFTFEGGWFWIIPFKGEITSVGAVLHRFYWRRHHDGAGNLLRAAIAACPPAQERLAEAEPVLPVMTEGSFSYRCSRFAGEGWVLCGDAAAFIDPIFSTGVYLTMSCAEEIAEAIDAGLRAGDASRRVFADYERRMRSGMEVFWRFIHGFYDESFIRIMLQPTNRFRLLSAVTGVLAGNVFPNPRVRSRLFLFNAIVRTARIVYPLRGVKAGSRLGD